MELAGKTILILGGSGLVGRAVARRLLAFGPGRVALVGLTEPEMRETEAALAPHAGSAALEIAWGNVFVPEAAARATRAEMLADAALRRQVLDDLLGELTPEVLERSYLFRLFRRIRPHAVVDCINTATAFAYQDVFHSARALVATVRDGPVASARIEEHVLSIPVPQLIRHIQILVEALRVAGTEAYVKIGTSGTGGMGFNIPYTHSEERPSRPLLTKSAMAGAHSLLLFLLSRTPGAPATIEIKPTAAIAWREIAYGPIRRGGRVLRRFDCPEPLAVDGAFRRGAAGWCDTGAALESVYADVGENGFFARDEFETVTALGQMEFVTPEEIADYVVLEVQSRSTGRNIVAALDAATAGPTYRAGVLRAAAVERLAALEREHGVRSVAFEMLGPPRLSKLLYEAFLLSRLRPSVRALAESAPEALAREAAALVARDADLRSTIVSVGLPIVIEGEKVYRAETVIVPPVNGDVERAVASGWVDARAASCAVWVRRAAAAVAAAVRPPAGSGSDVEWGAIGPDSAIRPSAFATWIFRHEEGGERIKR